VVKRIVASPRLADPRTANNVKHSLQCAFGAPIKREDPLLFGLEVLCLLGYSRIARRQETCRLDPRLQVRSRYGRLVSVFLADAAGFPFEAKAPTTVLSSDQFLKLVLSGSHSAMPERVQRRSDCNRGAARDDAKDGTQRAARTVGMQRSRHSVWPTTACLQSDGSTFRSSRPIDQTDLTPRCQGMRMEPWGPSVDGRRLCASQGMM
jgi:hypothetical protein